MRLPVFFRGLTSVYGKIFASMYSGTLYGHWEAIVTMQQLIVLADADGIVDMTPQAIAATTSIPLDIISKGLSKLEETDPYSRTPGEDGRRIVLIDEHRPWGWSIVNYQKYKHLKDSDEVRAQTRERVRRFRDKRNAEKQEVTLGNAEKRHIDTDIDIDTRKATTTAADAKRRPPKANGHRIDFDFSKGAFSGITEEDELRWQQAFPAVPIPPAIERAAAWLKANPSNRKSNYERFLVNWFSRDQDKAGRVRH